MLREYLRFMWELLSFFFCIGFAIFFPLGCIAGFAVIPLVAFTYAQKEPIYYLWGVLGMLACATLKATFWFFALRIEKRAKEREETRKREERGPKPPIRPPARPKPPKPRGPC